MEPLTNKQPQIWGPLPHGKEPKSAWKVECAVRSFLRNPTPESSLKLTKLAIHLKQYSNYKNKMIWERLRPETQSLLHTLTPFVEPPVSSSFFKSDIMRGGYIFVQGVPCSLRNKGYFLNNYYGLCARKALGLPTHNFLAIGAKGDWAIKDGLVETPLRSDLFNETTINDLARHFHLERLWELSIVGRGSPFDFSVIEQRCIYKANHKPEFSRNRAKPFFVVDDKLKEWEPELARQELKLKWLEKIGMENIGKESAIVFAMLLDTIADGELSPETPPSMDRLRIFVEMFQKTRTIPEIDKHLLIRKELKAQIYAYIFWNMPIKNSLTSQLKEFDSFTGNLLRNIAHNEFMRLVADEFCEEFETLQATFENSLLLLQFEARHSKYLYDVNIKLEALFRRESGFI